MKGWFKSAVLIGAVLLIAGCIQNNPAQNKPPPNFTNSEETSNVSQIPLLASDTFVFEGDLSKPGFVLYMVQLKERTDKMQSKFSLEIKQTGEISGPACVVYALGGRCAIMFIGGEYTMDSKPTFEISFDPEVVVEENIDIREWAEWNPSGGSSYYNVLLDCIGFFVASNAPVHYNLKMSLKENETAPIKYEPILNGSDFNLYGNFSRELDVPVGFANNFSKMVDVPYKSIQIFYIDEEYIVQNGVRNYSVRFSDGSVIENTGASIDISARHIRMNYGMLYNIDMPPGKFGATLRYVESSQKLEPYLITIGVDFSKMLADFKKTPSTK